MSGPEHHPVGYIPGPESNHLPTPGLPQGVNLPGTVPPPRRPGRMREQDHTTTARPETVAEARARDRAQRQRAADEAAAEAAAVAEAKKKRRRRNQMIGAGAGVGVVGTIALLYLAIPEGTVPTQTATCVAQDGQVVADSYCSTGSYNSSTGFILLAGGMYRYNYGGSNVGGRISGGTYDRPTGTAFRTPGGQNVDPGKATSFGASGASNNAGKAAAPTVGTKTGKSITRGGLGTSNKGGSGGKSGGS